MAHQPELDPYRDPSSSAGEWEGFVERPFTDWGQWGHGHLDLRVFDEDQGSVWVDVAGTPHQISKMTPDYRVNVLAFLDDNAAYYHLMTIYRLLIELYSDLGQDNAAVVERLRVVLGQDPTSWMASTPVVRALKGEGA